MKFGRFNTDNPAALRTVSRYGRFFTVRAGWRWDVIELCDDNVYRYLGLCSFWRRVSAERIARAMCDVRNRMYDEMRAERTA